MSLRKVHLPLLQLLSLAVVIGVVLGSFSALLSAGYRNLGFLQLLPLARDFSTADAAGDSVDPVNWLNRAQKVFPEDERLWYGLGLHYWFKGASAEASAALSTFLRAAPEDALGRFVSGEIAYNAGDTATALATWPDQALAMICIQRASDEIALGNLDRAQELLGVAVNGEITSYGTAYRLAQQYSLLASELEPVAEPDQMGSVCNHGSRAYELAISYQPSLDFVRINYGGFLRRCERYPDALAQYHSIEDTAEASTRAWASHEIALTYLILQDAEQALIYFEQAVEFEPQNGLYRISLGKAYGRLGNQEAARAQFLVVIHNNDPRWKAVAEKELANLE